MQIVCFGDSVTRGMTYIGGRLRIIKQNYPAFLQQSLSAQPDFDVVNKGTFNDTSDGLCARLQTDVLSFHPDYVLIEIGGNDCNFHWDEVALYPDRSHEPNVPLRRYLDNIRKMIEQIRDSGSVPIVMTLVPLDPVRYYATLEKMYGFAIARWIAICGGIEHWHAMYNQGLLRLIRSLSVSTIDLRTALKSTSDLAFLLSDDGIHPSALGYQVMSQTIFASLQKMALSE